MKKILILLVAISCSLGLNAQNKIEIAVENAKTLKTELEATLQALRCSNEKIENRKFETTEQSLRNRLAFYKDIKAMTHDNIFDKKPEFRKYPFANKYMSLIRMHNSLGLNGGYRQEENETFKSELDMIREQVMSMTPQHKESFIQSFDDLDNCIRYYRFAMFELARIFVLVKEKENEGLKLDRLNASLKEDEETDFVDKIPYAKKQLDDYIFGDEKQRRQIIKKLGDSCAEAFANFKE